MAVSRRIRFGEWLVNYDDPPKDIKLDVTLHDIMTAVPGSHVDCMNSRCIRAQRNEHIFPHPVYAVSTIGTRVYVVDELDDSGVPIHCFRYAISALESKRVKDHDKLGVASPHTLILKRPSDPKGSPHRKANYEASGDPRSRFSKKEPGGQWGGKQKRPVGAQARVVAAVGGLGGVE